MAWHVGLLLTAFGCGEGVKIGQVRGKVTLDGSPLPPGCVILFMPKSSGTDIGNGAICENGAYVACSGEEPGLLAGEYEVLVLPPALEPVEAEALENSNARIVATALMTGSKTLLEQIAAPQAAIVPKKYWTEGTSGLRLVVRTGENSADFELSTATN